MHSSFQVIHTASISIFYKIFYCTNVLINFNKNGRCVNIVVHTVYWLVGTTWKSKSKVHLYIPIGRNCYDCRDYLYTYIDINYLHIYYADSTLASIDIRQIFATCSYTRANCNSISTYRHYSTNNILLFSKRIFI